MHDFSRYVAITVDARDSGGRVDVIQPVLALLANELAADGAGAPTLPFQQTIGDELQGLLADGGTAARVLAALARTTCWVGIGIGEVAELRSEARLSGGDAFNRARDALDRAKTRRGSGRRAADANGIVAKWPVAAVADTAEDGFDVEYASALLWRVVAGRSPSQQRVADLTRGHASQGAIAERLDVERSTVSRGLAAAGWSEEQAAVWLTGRIIDRQLARAA